MNDLSSQVTPTSILKVPTSIRAKLLVLSSTESGEDFVNYVLELINRQTIMVLRQRPGQEEEIFLLPPEPAARLNDRLLLLISEQPRPSQRTMLSPDEQPGTARKNYVWIDFESLLERSADRGPELIDVVLCAIGEWEAIGYSLVDALQDLVLRLPKDNSNLLRIRQLCWGASLTSTFSPAALESAGEVQILHSLEDCIEDARQLGIVPQQVRKSLIHEVRRGILRRRQDFVFLVLLAENRLFANDHAELAAVYLDRLQSIWRFVQRSASPAEDAALLGRIYRACELSERGAKAAKAALLAMLKMERVDLVRPLISELGDIAGLGMRVERGNAENVECYLQALAREAYDQLVVEGNFISAVSLADIFPSESFEHLAVVQQFAPIVNCGPLR